MFLLQEHVFIRRRRRGNEKEGQLYREPGRKKANVK